TIEKKPTSRHAASIAAATSRVSSPPVTSDVTSIVGTSTNRFYQPFVRTLIRRPVGNEHRAHVHRWRKNMEPTNRRQFLKRSSAVAAAAGVVAAVPAGAARALTRSRSQESTPELPDDVSVDVPVVAHVTDVRKGLVSLYVEDREITIKNKR